MHIFRKIFSGKRRKTLISSSQEAVKLFAKDKEVQIEKSYFETECNQKRKYPELADALKYCQKENATLIIARLGKLKCSTDFIAKLLVSSVDFIALDDAAFNRINLPVIHADLVEKQKRTSIKIKASLNLAKKRGVKLGKHGKNVLAKTNKKSADDFAKAMMPLLKELKVQGYNDIRTLTAELNQRKIPTFRGNNRQWHLRTVNLLIKRIKPEMFQAKPNPVKWVGGKRGIIKELKKRLPVTFNHYYEPFFGGGALFFELHLNIKKAFLSDTNEDLITMYKVIQSDPKPLIQLLKTHARLHDLEYYYKIRAQHGTEDPVEIAARMLYLNKTCYNGLWRVNQKGEFNASFGTYTNPLICNALNIRTCSKSLQAALLKRKDYRLIKPKKGDFVYFDPPYQKTTDTSFTAYSKTGFTKQDQIRLAKFCKKLNDQGVNLMISNSNSDFIQELYQSPSFSIHVIKAPRMINSNPLERRSVEELIIVNF